MEHRRCHHRSTDTAGMTDDQLIAHALYVYWQQAQYTPEHKLAARAYELYASYSAGKTDKK
jgi:hypothetical protein